MISLFAQSHLNAVLPLFGLAIMCTIVLSIPLLALLFIEKQRKRRQVQIQRRLRRERVAQGLESQQQPTRAPFEERLASYVGVKPQEVMVDSQYESKMRFWTSVFSFRRSSPKSGNAIRRILLRIRRILGRSSTMP